MTPPSTSDTAQDQRHMVAHKRTGCAFGIIYVQPCLCFFFFFFCREARFASRKGAAATTNGADDPTIFNIACCGERCINFCAQLFAARKSAGLLRSGVSGRGQQVLSEPSVDAWLRRLSISCLARMSTWEATDVSF